MSSECGPLPDNFLTLPGSLNFDNSDYSDFEDFLTVPQHRKEFCLSSASSLDATDLFLGDLSFEASSETTSSFTSPATDNTSRLEELTSNFPLCFGDINDAAEQGPTAAPLPLGRHGLKLKLDCNSVLSAWHRVGSGTHPFQLRGPQLTAIVSIIPSVADLSATISAANTPAGLAAPTAVPTGSAATPVGSAAASSAAAAAAAGAGFAACDRAEEARRKDAVARFRDKKSSRKSSERKIVYTARKVNADKRPRIKGRFVTKAEFDQMTALQTVVGGDDHIVPVPMPGLVCA